ncbi:MAG TPA: hypothetical protein VM759_05605, partial [Longimicrobium sp.]|nr:hypothetical protein [Longimicrobium sp.]
VQPYEAPRFLPGGNELLVVRSAGIGGGATREDLFVWRWRGGGVRRVTHGASIRSADPLPDGRRAAAVQCLDGICGLVLVDLETGDIKPLAAGSAERVFDRPRVSPDGRTIAAAMQEGGRWRLVLVPVEGGPLGVIGGDSAASLYDPAWSTDGIWLTAVSEAGGVANLARVDLADGLAHGLTRVVGAAVAPETDPATGDVYFLSLHAGGWDVHRIHPGKTKPARVVPLPDSLTPAAQRLPGGRADTLARVPLPPSRPYGIGPRWTRIFPMGAANADGAAAGIIIHNADPVGRLALAARGAWGVGGLERGASATAVWRGRRPAVAAEAFWVDQEPSHLVSQEETELDASYGGAVLSAGNAWSQARNAQEWRVGASAGLLAPEDEDAGGRMLGFARYAVSDGHRSGPGYVTGALALAGSAGSTRGEGWARGTLSTAFSAGMGTLGVRAEATLGRVSGGAPAWERFTLGGLPSLLVDEAVVSQRIAMPALRWGALEGTDLLTYRLSTNLGVLTPYFWGGSTDPGWDSWLRVTGIELATSFPGLRAAAAPGARLLAGVAYGLDGGYENDVTAYIAVTYTP